MPPPPTRVEIQPRGAARRAPCAASRPRPAASRTFIVLRTVAWSPSRASRTVIAFASRRAPAARGRLERADATSNALNGIYCTR
jgi:hypothetical protein